MKAIQTRYISPTATRGLRIRAFDLDGNYIIRSANNIPGDDLGDSACRYAAYAFIDKMGWGWDKDKLVSGAVKDGYVFCFGGM